MKWFVKCLRNYANFRGRASRSEFWWFTLVMMALLFIVALPFYPLHFEKRRLVVGLLGLLFLLPYLAVAMRRLHDTGRSGWWAGGYLIVGLAGRAIDGFSRSDAFGAWTGWLAAELTAAFVLFAYLLLMIYWLCLPGNEGLNKYGPAPGTR